MARVRKAVRELKAYSPPTAGRGGKLRLDFNENTLGPPAAALEALARLGPEDLAAYPEYGEFERLLAARRGVSAQQVVVTNATDEAIKLFLQTFVEPGAPLVLPVPTYAMFAFYAALCGIPVIEVPYGPDLSFPTDELLAALDAATGGVILCNPNNPTGTLVPEPALERILQRAYELGDLPVLVDEAYHEFAGVTALPLIERFPGLVVSRTFSKAHGLAGLRLGYLISNREAAAALRKAASPYSVNTAALAAGRAALLHEDQVRAYVTQIDAARPLLVQGLRERGFKVHVGAGNFVLAWLGGRSPLVQAALAEQGVLARDRSADRGLFGVLRFTVGTEQQVRRALDALDNALGRRALLLDMDGVLLDVSQSYRAAICQTAGKFLGRAVQPAEVQELKQRGGLANDWELTRALILANNGDATLDQVTAEFQRLFLGGPDAAGLREREVWLPAAGLLERFKARAKLGIVTARPRAEAEWTLRRLGLENLFDALICAEDAPAKPSPAGIVLALKRLGCCAGAYCGDSVDDMTAARAAGLEAVGVLPAGVSAPGAEAALLAAGASRVLGSINELEGTWLDRA